MNRFPFPDVSNVHLLFTNPSQWAQFYADWTRCEKGGINVSPVFNHQLMQRERPVAQARSLQSDNFLNTNRGPQP